MEKKRCVERGSIAVAIPIYKELLSSEEEFSVDRTFNVLSSYPITFFCPQGLNLDYYTSRYPASRFKHFESHYFTSVQGYSKLLVQEKFYTAFDDKEFLLIVQPDVYLFRDELAAWVSSPFDYIGAPWPNGISLNLKLGKFIQQGEGRTYTFYVGNGGLSLRRIEKCKLLLEEHREIAEWFANSGSNEDLFFAFLGNLSQNFTIPNQVTASLFSMEMMPEFYFEINGNRLPMGAHAFRSHSVSFWEQHISSSKD